MSSESTILSEYNAIIKPVFIHWSQINYIDLIPPIDPELKRKEEELAHKLSAGIDHLNGVTNYMQSRRRSRNKKTLRTR
jgi:hypothetical protein